MIELTDEILNRYIDDELSPSEKDEVNEILKSSEDARRRLYAMKLVHTELKKYAPARPSMDFTSVLMKKIIRRHESKGQKYFIFSISSVFVIISLAIIGYLTSFILSTGKSTDEGSSTVNYFVQLVEKLVHGIQTLFSNGNVSIIGFIFSFAIIISAYFFFDSHKQARAKLTKL
jgi:hypothetical protein